LAIIEAKKEKLKDLIFLRYGKDGKERAIKSGIRTALVLNMIKSWLLYAKVKVHE
jgi:hypothetical protein